VRFYKLIKQILEAVADVPPPPPAIIQRAEDTHLTFDDILGFIKKHEGVRPHVYPDSLGIPTVGIGFNLQRPDAKTIFNKLNLNYNDILAGKADLTNDQVKALFTECLQIAYKDVKHYIPGFDNLPRNIKLGLLDMSFNLGYTRLSKFAKTKELIQKGDYKNAAVELKNSKWAGQVGNRARNIINLFSSAS
jgi:GH24 family phage-related lysozyme (muramidase)